MDNLNDMVRRDRVGYTLKVVNGAPFTAGRRNVSGCYNVQTPGGTLLLKPWVPSYYNPPMAYDRCSTPRPFGPRPMNCGDPYTGGNARCGCYSCSTSCGCGGKQPSCGCGSKKSKQLDDGWSQSSGGCGCKVKPKQDAKPVMYGYAGEHDVSIGPSFDTDLYQMGYKYPGSVYGRRDVGQYIEGKGKVKDQAGVQRDKLVTRELLKGNLDALLEHLVDTNQAPAELKKELQQKSVGQIYPKMPAPRIPVEFDHLRSEPRMYVLLHRSSPCPKGTTVPNMAERWSCMMEQMDEGMGVCRRKYQGYYNPWGQVNGPKAEKKEKKTFWEGFFEGIANPLPVVGQYRQLKVPKKQVVSLVDTLLASAGFNPEDAGNKKARKVIAKKLRENLQKQGLNVVGFVDGSMVVEGHPTVGFLQQYVSGIEKALEDTTRFMDQNILNPTSNFVQKNAPQFVSELKQVDKQLGITPGLQQFLKKQTPIAQRLRQQWPDLASMAFASAGVSPAILGALGPATQNLQGSNVIQAMSQSLGPLSQVYQQNGGLQRLLQQQGGVSNVLSSAIGQGQDQATQLFSKLYGQGQQKAGWFAQAAPALGQKGVGDVFQNLSNIGRRAAGRGQFDFNQLLGGAAQKLGGAGNLLQAFGTVGGHRKTETDPILVAVMEVDKPKIIAKLRQNYKPVSAKDFKDKLYKSLRNFGFDGKRARKLSRDYAKYYSSESRYGVTPPHSLEVSEAAIAKAILLCAYKKLSEFSK